MCLARPHLANPYWTFHAAAALGDREIEWPLPYLAGRDQLRRLAERGEGAGPAGAARARARAGAEAGAGAEVEAGAGAGA